MIAHTYTIYSEVHAYAIYCEIAMNRVVSLRSAKALSAISV